MAAADEPPTVTPDHRGGELTCCRLSLRPHSADFSEHRQCPARRQLRRKSSLVYDRIAGVNTELAILRRPRISVVKLLPTEFARILELAQTRP